MKFRWGPVILLVGLLGILPGCQPPGEEKSAEAVPIKEALAAGWSPVEVSPPALAQAGPGAATFNVTVKNITDAPLQSISWTAIAFDENGRPIPEGEVEGGYAEPLDPIAPGEARELSFELELQDAVRVKVVLKEVTYKSPNPVTGEAGDQAYKWANPFYAAELQKARGVSIPD